jgi:phosphoribosylamine--glycine ligase
VRVLVIGGGGREHALAWGLARSPSVDEVVVAPGNPGTEGIARNVSVDAKDPRAVAALADGIDADLVVVGPEEPLVLGAVDAVVASGRLAFGPTIDGARLEGSKRWMKELLAGAGVPTAAHGSFHAGDEEAALAFLGTLDGLYVVKTDGLAAGKGVVVTESLDEIVWAANPRNDTLVDLAEVLRVAGHAGGAEGAEREALQLYGTKGNAVAAASVRRRLGASRI